MTFRTYPKIKTLGNEENADIFLSPEDQIVIQEKMDGANFRFMKSSEGYLMFGSRTQMLQENGDHQYQKAFNQAISFIKSKLDSRLDEVPSGLIFFGENMVRHTLDYQWDKIPRFLGFDIYIIAEERFMPFQDAERLYIKLGLPTVPVLQVTQAKHITAWTDDHVPNSAYAPHKAEGVVFKNYDKGIFAKFVRQEFKEKNADVFGNASVKHADGEEAKFVAAYCTNARIDKAIFKLVDEGNKLELPLMKLLPNRVWTDIWEEEWRDITNGVMKSIDFKEARRKITKRCLAVLQQVIANNALERKPIEALLNE
jgi:hypothetical protein